MDVCGMNLKFDHGPLGADTCFVGAHDVIRADQGHQVDAALDALDAALAAGKWIAGYATYEMGYALEPKLMDLMPKNRALPLCYFGVYDAPQLAENSGPMGGADAQIVDLNTPVADWDFDRYEAAFNVVNDLIASGDIYQANLTFPLRTSMTGDAEVLYAALSQRQPVRYGAFVRHETDDLPDILSRSPELFFRTDKNGGISTRPMKGTQPRGATPTQDSQYRNFLAKDEKNRAENLMIVDLLRNDISRVAKTGSVTVPELFTVETYTTVHQMVSEVRAQLRPDVRLGAVLRALFPCGSITGAPKMRAMEVLCDLEEQARDIYCGSIGWAAPDGRSEFNVAIRTLLVSDTDVRLNVGGGIVWDSTAESEYEEALWKTRFAQKFRQ
jgi:para-aminobenzoate synthetase component 1